MTGETGIYKMAGNNSKSQDWYTRQPLRVVLFFWITCYSVVHGATNTTCFKDDSLGDREGNVYYCDNDAKPECCEENQEYTCCETQTSKTLKEQLILWGTVGGLVLLITLLCCYFWRDNVCSKSDTSLAKSCCTCCSKPENEDKKPLSAETQPGPSRLSHFSPRPWRFGGQGMTDDDRDSPAPAFHFKQTTYNKY